MAPPPALSNREEQFFRKNLHKNPCVRCGNQNPKYPHALVDCPNTQAKCRAKDTMYATLKPEGKKQTADVLIREIQEEYKADQKAREEREAAPRARQAQQVQQAQQSATRQLAPRHNVAVPTQQTTLAPTLRLRGTPVTAPQLTTTVAGGMAQLTLGSAGQSGASQAPQMTSMTAPASQAAATYPDIQYERVTLDMINPQRAPRQNDMIRLGRSAIRDSMAGAKLKTLAQSSLSLDFPLREGFSRATSTVLTNHFQIGIARQKDNPQATLYEYRILPALTGKSKRKIRSIIKTAIENCDVLNTNETKFATDYFDTIIAWSDLHTALQQAGHRKIAGGGASEKPEWELVTLQDGPTTLHLTIRFEGTVDLASFIAHKNMETRADKFDVQPVVRALNIVVSKCFNEPPVGTVPVGANKFYRKDSHMILTNGKPEDKGLRSSDSLCTLRGYSYTVSAGVGTILLNINSATSAFWKPVLLSTAMTDWTFEDTDWSVFEGILKGLRVYITYQRGDPKDKETYDRLNSEHARVKTIEGLGLSVENQAFEKNGQEVKVQYHLETTYNMTLQFPWLYAINLGTRREPNWYAPEHLKILPYQKYKGLVPDCITGGMLAEACQRPPQAKALIGVEGLETMGIPRTASEQVMAIPRCPILQITPAMLKVPSNKYAFPNIQYDNETIAGNERWNIRDKRLYRRPGATFNVHVLADDASPADVAKCINNLRDYAGPPSADGRHQNYSVATVARTGTWNLERDDLRNRKKIAEGMNKIEKGTNFVLLLLKNKKPTTYAYFKDLADRTLSLHSVCITQRCLRQNVGEKMSNIVLKLNLKAAGSNHTTATDGKINSVMRDTLVLGADVTHPGVGAIPGCPSIAAIVGSVDAWAGRFLGSMRLQKESKKEIIDEVEAMVRERIKDWVIEQKGASKFGTLPANILYYRDGVGDGQYMHVKTLELPQIRAAFHNAVAELKRDKHIAHSVNPPAPKVTAIVCAKRHGVRFYPVKDEKPEADRHQNCHPGTHVDDVVTSPFFTDFYLQSHAAIKGTAKPAHYFMLVNEMGRSVEDLRLLTHELCYTYVRAPIGVSYTAPAYYADRLCDRGRQYLRDIFYKTPKGMDVRGNFDKFKWDLEDAKRDARVAKWGEERMHGGTKRPKGPGEVEQEQIDRDEVKKKCEEWTMDLAKEEFYIHGLDKNPWHPNISKTMFWM